MKCIVQSYKYHLSWYCQTWNSIKALLQGVTNKAWTVEGKKATKICFLLPCAFPFQQTNSATQTVLYWDGNCATRPACNYSDDEMFHILISCANNNAEFPKLTQYMLSHMSSTLQYSGCPFSSNSNKGNWKMDSLQE